MNITKILFLASNPQGTDRLRLDEEVREIKEGLARSQDRERFQLETRLAVRAKDFYQAFLDIQPQIIHFSGHGAGDQGLVLEDDSGKLKPVSTDALARFFGVFESGQIECVLMNACYSEIQANAIHQFVDCVIGMNQAIGDKAAITFAQGFYSALGAGNSYEQAYKIGCSAIDLQGSSEYATPVLKYRSRSASDPAKPLDDLEQSPADNSAQSCEKPENQKLTVNMTAGDNAKQIGQIDRVETFNM
ncbi:CHAT domain-containing protein [Leptolyngbya ohadii]|uniref:CHAT domain-containing protein n=1 Tax=Leptolyngbya ohadii TaxID=1962290 RepID=UPI000B59F5FD|nr:CHAT domain-containing protein [Leptolyngbya ohadii]